MCVILQKCWTEKLHKKFSAFFKYIFLFLSKKKKKKWGGRFLKNLPSQFFFYLLIFHRGGDENLKKLFGMASFDTIKIHVGQCNLHTSKGH